MVQQASLLVTRVKRVDGLPRPAPPTRGRGRPAGVSRSALVASLGPHDGAVRAEGARVLGRAGRAYARAARSPCAAHGLPGSPAAPPALGASPGPLALLPPWPPGQGPPRGLGATRRFALGAVFGYHLALLSRHDLGAARRMGLKAFIRAA